MKEPQGFKRAKYRKGQLARRAVALWVYLAHGTVHVQPEAPASESTSGPAGLCGQLLLLPGCVLMNQPCQNQRNLR